MDCLGAVHILAWQASSPDISPIKHVRDTIGLHIRAPLNMQIWSNNCYVLGIMYSRVTLGTSISLYRDVCKHVSVPSTTDLNIQTVIVSYGWSLWH
ncbi:hypothetical protein TNCV_3167071 [Trichonephila clavipes]|uniref:Uncharacterized protein n=1 Tax=Trichonephila clavipes TaxID=2585209 RepID=A0A8X6RFT1_TRICX|nr:hypothetical protein TNCV_3167071 [Trichonephila clavipes]